MKDNNIIKEDFERLSEMDKMYIWEVIVTGKQIGRAHV